MYSIMYPIYSLIIFLVYHIYPYIYQYVNTARTLYICTHTIYINVLQEPSEKHFF